MKSEKTWLTCKEAAAIIGCSQRHVLNLIKKKNISTEKDDSGKHIIQKSEFFRVFPQAMYAELARSEENLDGNEATKLLEEKIRHLQEIVDEKKRQNEFLMGQIVINTDEKSKMLDALNNHARLLEFKETGSKAPSFSKKIGFGFNWWPFKRR